MPDMKLYSEIIFLQHYAKGGWAVENTRPYYTPLIPPTIELQRHLFWSNYPIPDLALGASNIRTKNKIEDFSEGALVKQSAISNKRQVLRNCVAPELGAHVLGAYTAFLDSEIGGLL